MLTRKKIVTQTISKIMSYNNKRLYLFWDSVNGSIPDIKELNRIQLQALKDLNSYKRSWKSNKKDSQLSLPINTLY
jgi:hypothetical protein